MSTSIDKARVEADLEKFRDEERSLREQLDGVLRERTRLEAGLEVLQHYGLTDGAPSTLYGGMTIAQAIEVYMKRVGGRARVTAVRDSLVDAGMLAGQAASRYGTLVQTMQRHKDKFEKVGTGEWRLKDSNNGNAPRDESFTGESPAMDREVPPGT